MKNTLKIVITGGLVDGRTIIIDELKELLRSLGYSVYFVNDAFRELTNSGIIPNYCYNITDKDFQALALDVQLSNEYIRKMAAEVCTNSKIAILYDKGILDSEIDMVKNIVQSYIEENMIAKRK